MAEKYSYRNLIVWEKAQTLALDVIRLVSGLPRNTVSDVLTRQVVRSSASIGANVAEGHGRFTPRAHANHLSIAKGSACETDSWIDLMRRSGEISSEQEQRLHQQCMELVPMLTAKIKELENTGRYRVSEDRAEWIVDP